MTEPWLTKTELAAELKVSPRTIERLRCPVALRVGGQNRYMLSQVEDFLAGAPQKDAEVVRLHSTTERSAA